MRRIRIPRTAVLWLQESLFLSSADLVPDEFLAEVFKAASAELKKRKVRRGAALKV